ncbi:unnamed protein product [Didymodactylos carnosus]|nr:unnamed protein product [Didymodactylos carnosus]CAF4476059.1 unnamed protein product [Didymodactylos carnosus]
MLQLKDQIKLQHLQKDIIYACVILTLELLIIYVSLRLGFIRLEKHYEKHLEKLHQNFNRNDGNITSDDYESIKKIE